MSCPLLFVSVLLAIGTVYLVCASMRRFIDWFRMPCWCATTWACLPIEPLKVLFLPVIASGLCRTGSAAVQVMVALYTSILAVTVMSSVFANKLPDKIPSQCPVCKFEMRHKCYIRVLEKQSSQTYDPGPSASAFPSQGPLFFFFCVLVACVSLGL